MDPDLILFNHHGESMRLSRIPIYQNQENIVIISEDGGKFIVSKFIFNFLSCFSSNETDIIMSPVSSKSLSSICQALSFNKVKDISLDDLQRLGITSNYFSTISISSMADKDINNSKEEESKPIPINMQDSCNEDEQDEKAAVFISVGLSEKTVYDKPDNSVVIHSNIIGKATEGLQIESECLYQKRKRYKGDPILEWKTMNGKEVLTTMTCQICGKVYERTNFSREGHDQLLIQHNRHFQRHKLQNKTCKCDIKFESLNEKVRHLKDVHYSYIKCPKCADFFANEENLELHLKNQHIDPHKEIHRIRESRQKVKCHECDKTVQAGFLQKHMTNAHHKNYSCKKCGKEFFGKDKLESHEEVEHKEQRFKCRYPECKSDQKYRDRSNRLAHERKKHGTTYPKFLAEFKEKC